jgi:DNA polymerase-1
VKKLYLVDVSSMFFRAFYAIPPLRTSTGLPTNALYGFLAMSIKLLRENKPDYMAFCFDRKDPSFRSELYEEYKANRTEMPEDLEPQIPFIRELTEKLGIIALDKEKYEADDVIGTLALLGARHGLDVSIVSGDKDFAQLVRPGIHLYDTMKNIRYDRAGVVEKWGVEPEQIIDYLSIVGDTSDNIPGVKGIGPVGAQKLLAEYKTLDGVYQGLSSIKSESTRNKLMESKDAAFLARKLVEIVTDIDLGVQPEDLRLKPIDRSALKELLDRLEFSQFMRKIFPDESDSIGGSGAPIEKSFGKKKSASKLSETTSAASPAGGSSMSPAAALSNEVGVSLEPFRRVQWTLGQLAEKVEPYKEIWAVRQERGFCLGYDGQAVQVDGQLEEIGQVLGPKYLAWKGFDTKEIWRTLGLREFKTPAWDSMLAAYVVKAGSIEDFSEVYQKYVGRSLPELAAPEDFLHGERELEAVLRAKLSQAGGLAVLENYELPLVPVIYDMESRGVLVDTQELKEQSVVLGRDIAELEKGIHKEAGESFNIASPKQLGVILFDKLKLPALKKTKTGYSTDSDVLSKLAAQHPICDLIVRYRELAKLKSTYVDSLPTLVDARDGRIHTRFQQAVTQTGRLSSINPNLQNIPIRTERGRAVRKAFIARPGRFLLSIDYSQIELRILAQITGDPGLTEAFLKGHDIHRATAAEIFGVSLEDVTTEHRNKAKAVNFGIAYGQGVFGLAETLEIERDEAKTIIENYFAKFPKVKEYMLDTVTVAKERGYVETIFGRRRYMDEFNSSNGMIRKFGERAAINAPIQGAASDLLKKAMIEVHESSAADMLMTVHDELVFEVDAGDVEFEAQDIKRVMESVAKFNVPLAVNVAWGENWEDAHA